MNSSHSDRYDYRVRIQVPIDSADAVLLEYLKEEQNQVYSHKEMVLSALRAYWLPIAYENYRQYRHGISEAELKRLARNSIFHLRERADLLLQHFCPDLSTGILNGTNNEAQPSSADSALPLSDQSLLHRPDQPHHSQHEPLD